MLTAHHKTTYSFKGFQSKKDTLFKTLNNKIVCLKTQGPENHSLPGADPGFFLGGAALVSYSTSTPINHLVFFFWQNTSCIRKRQVISGGGGCAPPAPPLDPHLPVKQHIYPLRPGADC